MKWLFRRPTREVVMILLAGTICFVVLATGTATALYVFLNPGAPIAGVANFIGDVTNTLIGLLAGYLAGRTEVLGNGASETTPETVDEPR